LLNAWRLSLQGDSLPKSYEDADKLKPAHAALVNSLTELARYVDVPRDSEPLQALSEALEDLDADRQTAMKIPAIRQYERELDELGVTAFVDEIRTEGSSPEHWTLILRFAWLSSCLEQLIVDEPELAVFNGREHDKVVAEFKALDKARLEVAVQRVLRAWAESARAARNQHRDQDLLLGHQANLQRRHLPFRELLRRAPDVVTAIKPCWMASPLSVSQILGGNRQYFDAVIFDEASQVLPEDAVTAILRGRSVVVAGDPDQLPPTAFFAVDRDDRDTDPTEDTEGFESILKVMESFLPQWNLDWHYRSRDERLIAFSNHYIYKDRLVTFPSNGTADAFAHVLVSQSQFNDADELSASGEVSKVVELVLEHAERCPDMSLGVIAFGIKHSNRIDAELAKARRIRPDLDAFFDAHPDEKFFVKNLERVQGDERDAIILSVGYGKVAGGTLRYYFGPLLSEHGYRRLNVAATRAKSRLTLVSSFGHQDMDPARSDRRGVELLRLYLQYAASGGEVFGDSGPTISGPNEFELEVQRALENEGLAVVPQFGASRYRIDLVVQHPEQPGRYVLAVECDGATYHSSLTARDRDRLRQEHLEARGWRFVRIWSTDWFMRRSEEVARVVHAYRRALEPTEEADVRVSGELLLAPPTESAVPRPRLSRLNPHNPPGLPIWRYRDEDLIRHACWIRSDGRLRTDEELLKLMLNDLKLTRRAEAEARVMDAILQANSGACDEPDR